MIIGQLKTVIAANLHKPVTDFVVGSGGNQVDLLLLALNNARKVAERFHDFSFCRKRGYLSVLTSANWTTPTWFDASSFVMRKVKNWMVRVQGSASDGEFGGIDNVVRAITTDQKLQLYAREDYRNSRLGPAWRYPGDVVFGFNYAPLVNQKYVIVDGQRITFDPVPSTTMTVIVDGFYWWPNWTLDADTDWWTENGVEYLLNRATVEANRLVAHFVGNQEGNLPPPTKEADQSLMELVSLDTDQTDGSVNIYDM